jgi:hypothetical protein
MHFGEVVLRVNKNLKLSRGFIVAALASASALTSFQVLSELAVAMVKTQPPVEAPIPVKPLPPSGMDAFGVLPPR